MQTTLVILAAGMASRYGSMKQTEGFGPSGETILEYSVYDAIAAGFKRVVFIIREDFAEPFKQALEPKLKSRIEMDYVYQSMDKFTEGYTINPERTKPWGTAHAVLCCKGKLDHPFAVINADDYYGKDSFQKAFNFLQNGCNKNKYGSIAYELVNTLSEHGTVSRGVISIDENNQMTGIKERLKISRKGNEIVDDEENGNFFKLSENTKVSMNFFCYDSTFIDLCESEFKKFLDKNAQELKAEFLIPTVTDYFIKSGQGQVEVIPTSAKWFGVTYKEDAPFVSREVKRLVEKGEYPSNLWA
ncbi:MAG: nucleotidyltransferase [Bacteroidetes bacterium]|nr:nucleotidyltransferase [Bacteroidota bacterium]